MKLTAVLFTLLMFLAVSCSGDIAQWRGPERDGIYPGKGLLKKWPEEGPQLALKIEGIGKGYSQPVVYDKAIYVTGIKSDTVDVVSAYSLSGEKLWETVYSRAWERTYPESRGTPTIEKGRIYLIGGMGDLVCIDAKSGEIQWKHNPNKDFQGDYMGWGVAESALLTDKDVLYITGGKETTVVAFNKKTGKLHWKSKSTGGRKAYASSSLVEWEGKKIALIQTSDDLVGIDVKDGSVLWTYNTIQYHVEKGKGEAANTPLFKDGEVFVTYGNNQPGLKLRIPVNDSSFQLVWRNDVLDTHHGGLVLLDGTIYGSTMVHNTKGNWAAVDWESGQTFWEKEWYTKGSVISADGMLYLYEERTGHVALVKPGRDDLEIISEFRITEGTGPHWSHPSIYHEMLLIRHGDVLMGYDISAD
jgi:outer membrane protein assembly factor BamB